MTRASMNRLTAGLVRMALTAAVALCAVTAEAASIVDSQGFENPPYSLGNLTGQNSWVLSGPGVGSATVQNTVVMLPGAQAVKVDRGANSDDRWYVPVVGYPTGQYIAIDWDMNVTQTVSAATYGPLFGVEAYDYSATGPNGVLGTLGVDAFTGDVLYQRADNGSLDATGTTVTFGQWDHYKMLLDFGTDVYTVYLNGTPLLSEVFVDSYTGNDLDDFTDADISALAAFSGVADLAAVGTAYYDNFTVTPEPSSLVLMLLGSAVFFWMPRRRRR